MRNREKKEKDRLLSCRLSSFISFLMENPLDSFDTSFFLYRIMLLVCLFFIFINHYMAIPHCHLIPVYVDLFCTLTDVSKLLTLEHDIVILNNHRKVSLFSE